MLLFYFTSVKGKHDVIERVFAQCLRELFPDSFIPGSMNLDYRGRIRNILLQTQAAYETLSIVIVLCYSESKTAMLLQMVSFESLVGGRWGVTWRIMHGLWLYYTYKRYYYVTSNINIMILMMKVLEIIMIRMKYKIWYTEEKKKKWTK